MIAVKIKKVISPSSFDAVPLFSFNAEVIRCKGNLPSLAKVCDSWCLYGDMNNGKYVFKAETAIKLSDYEEKRRQDRDQKNLSQSMVVFTTPKDLQHAADRDFLDCLKKINIHIGLVNQFENSTRIRIGYRNSQRIVDFLNGIGYRAEMKCSFLHVSWNENHASNISVNADYESELNKIKSELDSLKKKIKKH